MKHIVIKRIALPHGHELRLESWCRIHRPSVTVYWYVCECQADGKLLYHEWFKGPVEANEKYLKRQAERLLLA